MALYQCTWRWPGTGDSTERSKRFGQAFVAADRDVAGMQSMVRGWYSCPGEWAGFLLLEAERPEDLAAALRPFTALMTWEVKPLLVQDYADTKRLLAQVSG